MNILDKAIAVFAPGAGLKRASARALLDQYRERDYAAARNGRRNRGWRSRSTSANVEIAGALSSLRDRAREFVRDSWQGQRILDVLVSHAVGTGITVVPNTGSDRADNRFRMLWQDWLGGADAEGVMDFGAMQALAVRSMIEGGESVLRFIDPRLDQAGGLVPLWLQGLEGDQIDSTKDRGLSGDNFRLGVELGDYHRRQALWLHPDHPGDMTLAGAHNSTRVPWNDLCHLYRPLRWGQIRGVSWFSAILLTGKEDQDLIEAAIVQARTQASFAGFLKRQPGGANVLAAKKDEDGEKVTKIAPGTIADIGDSDIVFANPSSQSSFQEIHVAAMQGMAAGAWITYDQLTGDLTRANYSSLKAGRIEFRRLIEQLQWGILAPRMVLPTVRRFRDRALLAGMLPPRRDGYRVDLIMPANEPIDPKKDMEADIMAVRSGRMTPQEFMSAWGVDWRKNIEDVAAFFAATDKANVTLDIDPRRPAQGGPQRVEMEQQP